MRKRVRSRGRKEQDGKYIKKKLCCESGVPPGSGVLLPNWRLITDKRKRFCVTGKIFFLVADDCDIGIILVLLS